ncbi:predicted protein [Nematostella vectensis]|uniref:Uncharacterized protein n=2 Tax=Nematostella vectensis TaxID=45351 RepID=A7SB95_NEMVE|nr:predicted protein [Nematostella vectensis]|eukprot:XP_001631136.1 predicted protein [Nematostella vectensis]
MPWAIQYATLNPQMTANPITVGPNVPYAVIPNPGVPLGNNFSSVMPSTMSPSLPFFVAPLAANQMPYPALPHLAGPGNALPLGQEGMVGPRPLNLPMPAINQGSVAMTSLTNSLSVMPSVAGPGRESRKEVVTIDLDDLPSPTLDKTKESQPSPSPQGDRSSSTSTEEVVTELEVAEAPRTGAPPSNEVHSYLTNHSGAMGAGPSVTSASPALTLAVLQNLLNARGGLAADAPVRPVSEGEAESAPLGDRVSQAEEPDEAIM